MVRVALRPVNALVLTVEQACELAVAVVAERISQRGIPEEKVITPPPEVAGAVVLGLQTAAFDNDLRNLFANLLTTAMVAETSDGAHPAFADMVRQLSPPEARIIESFGFGSPEPLVEFSGVSDQDLLEGGWAHLTFHLRHILGSGSAPVVGVSASLADDRGRKWGFLSDSPHAANHC